MEMKSLLHIFLIALSLVGTSVARSQPYPPVYLTLVSHNEDNIQ